MPRLWRRSAAVSSLLLLAAAVGQAQPRSRADCEAAYSAAWGPAGKDVPWVPTFDAVVLAMLTMTRVTKPPFGARATGIEYDPDLAHR